MLGTLVGLQFTAYGAVWARKSTVRLSLLKPLIARHSGLLCRSPCSACRWLTWHLERYTEIQRSQHLTQSDPRVFREYVANCSSVAGMSAFLDEKADHREVDYFQGLEQFREQGLPYQLPAAEREKLQSDSILRDRQQTLRDLKLKGAPSL